MTSVYSSGYQRLNSIYISVHDDYATEFGVWVAPDDRLWFGDIGYCPHCGEDWDTDDLTEFTDFAEFVRKLTTWASENDYEGYNTLILNVANFFDHDHRDKIRAARDKVVEIRDDLTVVNALINSLYKRRARLSLSLDAAQIEYNKLTD